jgi:hypothetical protein
MMIQLTSTAKLRTVTFTTPSSGKGTIYRTYTRGQLQVESRVTDAWARRAADHLRRQGFSEEPSRVDYDVQKTDTKWVRVLGFRTVQETRSSHWRGVTVVVRTRLDSCASWTEVTRFDVRGNERWDRDAINRMGGRGALVTDQPSAEEVDAAINLALSI